MKPEAITPDVARQTLRDIRTAKSLADSPLLHLDAMTVRLGSDRRASSRETRAAFLPRWLDEITWEQLTALRGEDPGVTRGALSPTRALSLLEHDFQSHSTEREAWGILHFRYFSGSRATMLELAATLNVSYNTVRRRVGRGFHLLASVMGDLERDADTTVTRGHHVPEPLTRFIGRDREIADVRALLAEHRLVTLTGPGGIGKSRLAIRVASDLAADYPDGAWFVELAAVDDENLVPTVVANTLGLREEPRRPITDTLVDFLADRHTLLVLDNCEQLARACGRLVDVVLRRAPAVQVLAASREHLGVAGEAAWSVPPMAVPPETASASVSRAMHFDSVRLFASRAAEANTGFELSDGNAKQVASLCAELEGIPLAVELASARLMYMTLDQLEVRLVDRFQALRDGTRATRRGHESLLATMDWSYELLSEQERALLRRLSVFRGGWTLEAADAVCSGDGINQGDVLQLLTQLEAKSLVLLRDDGDGTRYRMLETVRMYARVQLEESGAVDERQSRHLAYCLALAEAAEPELEGSDEIVWMRKLDSERDNLRAALEWSRSSGQAEQGFRLGAALFPLWYRGGRYSEGARELSLLLNMNGDPVDTIIGERVLRGIAVLHTELGEYEDAQRLFEEILAVGRESGDAETIAHAQLGLGGVALHQGEVDAATNHFEEAVITCRGTPFARLVARALGNLGVVARIRGDYRNAQRYSEECLSAGRGLGDRVIVQSALNNLGIVALNQDQYDKAARRFEEILALSRDIGDRNGIARSLGNLGTTAWSRGDLDAARRFHEESLIILRELGVKKGVALELNHLGRVSKGQGYLDDARSYYEESRHVSHAIGDRLGVGCSLNNLGNVAMQMEDHKTARFNYDGALAIFQEVGHQKFSADALSNQGELSLAEGDLTAAQTFLRHSTVIRRDLGEKRMLANSLDEWARLVAAQGQSEYALRLLGAAPTVFAAIGAGMPSSMVASATELTTEARTRLDDQAVDNALAEGRALTLDETVAYALGEATWDELAARIEAGEGEAEVAE